MEQLYRLLYLTLVRWLAPASPERFSAGLSQVPPVAAAAGGRLQGERSERTSLTCL